MRVVGIVLGFLLGVFLAQPLLAADKPGSKSSDNPYVRLASFLAPGLNAGGKRVQFPMTLVFEVSKDTDIRRFCAMSPRIRDAIMLEMFKKPVKVGKGRRINKTTVATRLTSVANGALGKVTIVETHVFNEIMQRTSGAANSAEWRICKNR
ncbi:MAG: hypothetical protein ISR44_00570 [Rhodospirillales bacterium]|nr:hypothetical protein [Rhodospirillales bacterium]